MAKSKPRAAPRYRVTQPQPNMNYEPDFPPETTRVGSNNRFILAANHPDWYFTALREEERMIAFLSLDRLQAAFKRNAALLRTDAPAAVYAFVLISSLREYVARFMPGNEEMRQVFNHAVFTVITNLRRDVFADPKDLTGDSYTSVDFVAWRDNLDRFLALDAFTYRPPETGRDVDGKRKPIIEPCPAPRLGRHLVRAGYEILCAHMAERFPKAAALALVTGPLPQRGAGEE